MGLVEAKCTNCGAVIEVDPSKDAAVCTACGTPFIVEKAINNYSTEINNYYGLFNEPSEEGAYEGDRKDGKRHGFGVVKYSNGDVYEGNWLSGKKSGNGKYTYEDGSIWEGVWKNDKQWDGEGIKLWENENDHYSYSGRMKSGKFNGYGVYCEIDAGYKWEGIWKDGNEWTGDGDYVVYGEDHYYGYKRTGEVFKGHLEEGKTTTGEWHFSNEKGVFEGKDDTLVNISGNQTTLYECIIPKGVRRIKKGISLSWVHKLVLPESIKEIKPGTFIDAGEVEELIAPGITKVKKNVFVEFDEDWDVLDCWEELHSISLPAAEQIDEWAFAYLPNLEKVEIPKVQKLEEGVFAGCASLRTVVMPKVNTIIDRAFEECDELDSATKGKIDAIEAKIKEQERKQTEKENAVKRAQVEHEIAELKNKRKTPIVLMIAGFIAIMVGIIMAESESQSVLGLIIACAGFMLLAIIGPIMLGNINKKIRELM